jgi:hypothetical protein
MKEIKTREEILEDFLQIDEAMDILWEDVSDDGDGVIELTELGEKLVDYILKELSESSK